MKKPKDILAIYDNGGETFDRYTVVLKYKETPKYNAMLCLSDNPNRPNNFSQFSYGESGSHLGKKISFKQLPNDIQDHIVARLQ